MKSDLFSSPLTRKVYLCKEIPFDLKNISWNQRSTFSNQDGCSIVLLSWLGLGLQNDITIVYSLAFNNLVIHRKRKTFREQYNPKWAEWISAH